MPTPVLPAALRRSGVAAAVVAALAVLLLSHSFGRAVPTNNYRPLLTTDPIEAGCFPLPGGAQLDGLAYQVRRDADVATPHGPRRELRAQYDLVGRDEAVARIVNAFGEVGFREAGRDEDGDTLRVRLARGKEDVVVSAADLPATGPGTLVRGELVLDLPVAELASADPACADPRNTKRWGAQSGASR